MSKAFTRESDDATSDAAVPVRPHVPPGAKNYITREGADRLRHRLEDLLAQKQVLAGTSDENDLNLREVLSRIDPEIQKLRSILDSIIIAEPPVDQQKVAFGASVRVRDENGVEETYQIVGFDEADPAHGRISSGSPLARALLARQAGDRVHFQSPAGPQDLTILAVHFCN